MAIPLKCEEGIGACQAQSRQREQYQYSAELDRVCAIGRAAQVKNGGNSNEAGPCKALWVFYPGHSGLKGIKQVNNVV